MKTAKLSAYAAIAVFFTLQIASAAESEIWLLQDVHGGHAGRWCAYRDRKAVDRQLSGLSPDDGVSTATLHYKGGQLTQIDSAAGSDEESVSDSYFLNATGALDRLERDTEYYHWSLKETYLLGKGRPRKVSTKRFDFNGRAIPSFPPVVEMYRAPIVSSLKRFAFYSLVNDPAIQTRAKLCVVAH